MRPREAAAVFALGFILAVTVVWWALALWPLPSEAPDWLVRTRLVCFGAEMDGLPTRSGWILLVGEPLAMLGALFVIRGRDVLGGLRVIGRAPAGRAMLRVVPLLILVAISAVGLRVARASASWAPEVLPAAGAPTGLTRIHRPAPLLRLVDQHGDTISLAGYRGRPVLVTFAFGHCETVCPLVVRDALQAAASEAGARPVVLVVTLDPWRDAPSRLAGIAERWRVSGDAHVLGGSVETVESVLDAWGVARARDGLTGDIAHAPAVYVVDAAGRIAYAVNGGTDAIRSAMRSL